MDLGKVQGTHKTRTELEQINVVFQSQLHHILSVIEQVLCESLVKSKQDNANCVFFNDIHTLSLIVAPRGFRGFRCYADNKMDEGSYNTDKNVFRSIMTLLV